MAQGGYDGTPDTGEILEGADDQGGQSNQPDPNARIEFPLNSIEILARNHALLCTIGFLILLPVGVLLARYARNFTRRWFWGHAVMQLVISGPVIFAGWSIGHHLAEELEVDNLHDPHQKIGEALLGLYVAQLLLGMVIHFFKTPKLLNGHRPPQNYLHAILGLAIIALAGFQVHYGLTFEWFYTGGLHQVPNSALNAWMALLIVFWVLYFLGMAFLPRQYKAEAESRRQHSKEDSGMSQAPLQTHA